MTDLAGKSHWDGLWEAQVPLTPVDPSSTALRNFVNRRFDAMFQPHLEPLPAGSSLIEVGCGASRWLPYFALRFGLTVRGLDYSRAGCEIAAAVAERAGVAAEIVCADLFDPPAEVEALHDVAVSFGVVEHFPDTAGAVSAISRLVRPGGMMITSIPNMAGWVGGLQRVLDREVYDIHVPLDAEQLTEAHREAGLEVISCQYLLFSHFGVVAMSPRERSRVRRWFKKAVWAMLLSLSVASWVLERAGLPLRANRRTSPYIVCVARMPHA